MTNVDYGSFVQFLFSGLTIGAVYAIVAVGFTIIYAASEIVNFAQGEFVVIGGMVTVFLAGAGIPLPFAVLAAVAIAILVGVLLYQFALSKARRASPVGLIIITLGASIFIKGVAGALFDKQSHSLPPVIGADPVSLFGASILPQSLLMLAASAVMFTGLWLFLDKTKTGKAMRATAANALAAGLVGINVRVMLVLAFALSAGLGALAGVLITPITLTRYDMGVILALKGFSAAILGGLGSPIGAVLGGLILGLLEALSAGYITSVYKDGIAFIILILVLLLMPRGIVGSKIVDRV